MQEIAAEIILRKVLITKMNLDELRRKLEYSPSKENAVCRASIIGTSCGIDE
jgi:hypothetical protein